MNLSIFEVLGPVMIGPSSSHTAGAAKLARAAARFSPPDFCRVDFELSGSFAKTGRGHGTDRALLAGALGLGEADEGIRDAFGLARRRHIDWSFSAIDLPDCHENTARITFRYPDGSAFTVTGSSIGGGRILITDLNGAEVEFSAEAPTVLVRQQDRPGVISQISRILADAQLNIAVMRLSRSGRGEIANTVIETDAPIPPEVAHALRQADHILDVRIFNP